MTGPQFVLSLATPEQSRHVHDLNSEAWAGDLSLKQYHEREARIAATPLTRDGGLRCWVLLSPADNPPKILSSCETIKKRAFVSTADGKVEEVVGYGIGSVFTPPDVRGKGYAGIMLRTLAEKLKQEQPSGFSALYSDIGKIFYRRNGWLPHVSRHLEFPAISDASPVEGVEYLRAADVEPLCIKDEQHIRESMSKPSPEDRKRVTFIPCYQTMLWHWAREEYVAPILRKHVEAKPDIKGVMSADGQRWMIWNRDFGKQSSQLYILRYVNLSRGTDEKTEEREVASMFKAAGVEAVKWGLEKIIMWSPEDVAIRAARKAVPSLRVEVIDRDEESIASIMMHGGGSTPEDVDWVENQKFGWC